MRSTLLLLALLAGVRPGPAAAQTPDSLPVPAPSPPVIRWWHAAAAAGGLSALMLLDHPMQRYSRHNSGTGADNVAGVVRHFGQPEVFGTVTVGLIGVGLIAHRPEIARAGGRLAASLVLAGGTEASGKQCEALLGTALDVCERHFTAFQFVVWAGKSAREALDAAMFDTSGEA